MKFECIFVIYLVKVGFVRDIFSILDTCNKCNCKKSSILCNLKCHNTIIVCLVQTNIFLNNIIIWTNNEIIFNLP